ncbi:hypothetical protein D3C78_798570 [compost metagenome]
MIEQYVIKSDPSALFYRMYRSTACFAFVQIYTFVVIIVLCFGVNVQISRWNDVPLNSYLGG